MYGEYRSSIPVGPARLRSLRVLWKGREAQTAENLEQNNLVHFRARCTYRSQATFSCLKFVSRVCNLT